MNRLKGLSLLKYFLILTLVLFGLQALSWWSPFPSPSALAIDLARLASRGIWSHLVVSFSRILISLCSAAIIGIFLGVIGSRASFGRLVLVSTVLPILEALPPIVWTVVCVLLFGISNASVVFIVTFVLVQFFAVNTIQGIASIDERYLEMAHTYTRKPISLFRHIQLPMILPFLLSALRISYGVAWKVIILAEMFGASNGIGYLLNTAYYALSIDRVVALGTIVVVVFLVTDRLITSPAGWLARKWVV